MKHETDRKFETVRQSVPRRETLAKVTGEARYTDDLEIPGMVYGRVLRSPYAHARVLRIARNLPVRP